MGSSPSSWRGEDCSALALGFPPFGFEGTGGYASSFMWVLLQRGLTHRVIVSCTATSSLCHSISRFPTDGTNILVSHLSCLGSFYTIPQSRVMAVTVGSTPSTFSWITVAPVVFYFLLPTLVGPSGICRSSMGWNMNSHHRCKAFMGLGLGPIEALYFFILKLKCLVFLSKFHWLIHFEKNKLEHCIFLF